MHIGCFIIKTLQNIANEHLLISQVLSRYFFTIGGKTTAV